MLWPPSSSGASLLSSVRVLQEGVDIHGVELAVLVDSKFSVVIVVQIRGHIIRLAPGKEYVYILLPIFIRQQGPDANQVESVAGELALRFLKILMSLAGILKSTMSATRQEMGERESTDPYMPWGQWPLVGDIDVRRLRNQSIQLQELWAAVSAEFVAENSDPRDVWQVSQVWPTLYAVQYELPGDPDLAMWSRTQRKLGNFMGK